jgi:hypothetical protein
MLKIPELAEKSVHKLFPILDAIIPGSDTPPSRLYLSAAPAAMPELFKQAEISKADGATFLFLKLSDRGVFLTPSGKF